MIRQESSAQTEWAGPDREEGEGLAGWALADIPPAEVST